MPEREGPWASTTSTPTRPPEPAVPIAPAVPADDEASVERVAKAMYKSFHEQGSDLGEEPTPYEWVPWGRTPSVTKFWHAMARAALAALREGQQK